MSGYFDLSDPRRGPALRKDNRRMAVTFLVAGVAAVVGEHLLRPYFKRGLKG